MIWKITVALNCEMTTSPERMLILIALDHPELLTEWESNLINDLAEKDDTYQFSERQIESLVQIGKKIEPHLHETIQ